MPYLKFTADYLFTGTEMLHRNHVLITDEKGNVQNIIAEKDSGDDVQYFKGLLTPGFINAHCHLELSHMKEMIPNRTGLVDFLIAVIQQRNIEQEKIFKAIRNAEQELYNSGTVAVGDICNTIDTISIKQKSKLRFHNFIEAIGFSDDKAVERFAFSKNIEAQFQSSIPNSKSSIVPHAPYSVSKKMFELINDNAENKIISIHNQECAAEDELYKNKTGDFFKLYDAVKIDSSQFQQSGKSSLQTYLPWLNKATNIILVHNTYSSEEDIQFAKHQSKINNQELFFCVCPNANLYIEGKMPPFNLLRKNNCNIVIGTDSYASNWSLNMLDEIRRIQHESAFTISTEEILQWATINCARALEMDDTLGSFEKGKQPGVVLIDELVNQNITVKSSAKRLI